MLFDATNEDSMADLTINGSNAVKSLFKTSLPGGNPDGLPLQGAAKPLSTAPPPPLGGPVASPNAAFPLNVTQNLGSRWVPDVANLGLPIIQGMLPTPPSYPELTVGYVESGPLRPPCSRRNHSNRRHLPDLLAGNAAHFVF